ncbi:general substrate transporter [Rhexocercosporidium sp. MPI-PUGE-AT-0058]|nr:general substrate transporter [Rhexocercosporidium sp. MPI-PUGE-AT-0058]
MESFTTLTKHRGAIYVSLAANTAALLFGADTGSIGAIVALQSFRRDFGLLTSRATYADASGTVVTLLNAGALAGCLAPALLGHKLGRRPIISIAGVFFLVGGILQTAAHTSSLSMIYAGRTIAGFGIGIVSNTVPVFVAECAPKHLRGVMVSAFDLFLVIGGIVGFFTAYGCAVHLSPVGSVQWRVSMCIQIPLAVVVILSPWLLNESPRYFAKRGEWVKAVDSLCNLRGASPDDIEIALEIAEMRLQIEDQQGATQGRSIGELYSKGNRSRLLWGIAISALGISGGHNVILYYGPQVFNQIGFTSQNSSLLGSGMILVVKLISIVLFMLGPVQYMNRKVLLMSGTFLMGTCVFIFGALLKLYPPGVHGRTEKSASSKAMMAMIYIFQVGYSISWGPLLYVYVSEIFPTRTRDYGVMICTIVSWSMNLILTKVGPIAILNIGYKTWMIFGTLNIVAMIMCFFLPETKNVSLEGMDVVFGSVEENIRKEALEMKLGEKQFSVIKRDA